MTSGIQVVHSFVLCWLNWVPHGFPGSLPRWSNKIAVLVDPDFCFNGLLDIFFTILLVGVLGETVDGTLVYGQGRVMDVFWLLHQWCCIVRLSYIEVPKTPVDSPPFSGPFWCPLGDFGCMTHFCRRGLIETHGCRSNVYEGYGSTHVFRIETFLNGLPLLFRNRHL